MNALPVEGWYADSEDPGLIRWWDGTQWTSNTRPAPTAEPASDPQPGPLPVIPDLAPPSFGPPDPDPVVEAAAPAPMAPAAPEASRTRRGGHPTPEDYRRRVEELGQEQASEHPGTTPALVTEPASPNPPDSPDEGAVIVSARTQDPENDLLSSMGYVFAVLAPPVGIAVSIALFIKGDERARYVLGVAILFCIIGVLFFL